MLPILLTGTSYYSAGVAYVLVSSQKFVLPQGVTVHSTDDNAIFSKFSGNTITIGGILTGFADSIHLSSGATGATVNVQAGGVVGSIDEDGIETYGADTTVNNYGLIFSMDDDAVDVNETSGIYRINNYGTMTAQNDGVAVYNSAHVILKNTGLIDGGSLAYNGDDGVDAITNSGTMRGSLTANSGIVIKLLGGADSYEGAGGRVNGIVSGGEGVDQLSGGAFTDKFAGDEGSDFLLGRGGRDYLRGDVAGGAGYSDTFKFNATIDSLPTATGRDLIYDFNLGNDKIDLFDIDANTGAGGNQAFALLAKGTAVSAVGTGKIGWYWVDNANDALDRTILRINNDADAAIEMQIELVGLKLLSAIPGNDFVF